MEKTTFATYKDEKTKKEKIASAILKNKYVGEYHLNEFGKPISDNFYFNVSHSDYLVALIVDSSPIGIDVERIRAIDSKLKKYISNDKEKEYIHDDESFFEIWTNKEALVKCVGTGIKTKPNNIPGLPLNDKRDYKGNIYLNKTIRYLDYVITTSRLGNDDYSLEISEVLIDD